MKISAVKQTVNYPVRAVRTFFNTGFIGDMRKLVRIAFTPRTSSDIDFFEASKRLSDIRKRVNRHDFRAW